MISSLEYCFYLLFQKSKISVRKVLSVYPCLKSDLGEVAIKHLIKKRNQLNKGYFSALKTQFIFVQFGLIISEVKKSNHILINYIYQARGNGPCSHCSRGSGNVETRRINIRTHVKKSKSSNLQQISLQSALETPKCKIYYSQEPKRTALTKCQKI